MTKHNQYGQISAVVVSLVFTVLILVAALGFGGWAFMSRQDYKNNTDQKIAAAVTVAKQQEDSAKDKLFAEQEKSPFRTYTGLQSVGRISFEYPKTWSGYVDTTQGGGALLDAYFNPGEVPSVTDQNSKFALHVQVLDQSYDQVIQGLQSQQQSGLVKVDAYALPKVPNAVGVRATGAYSGNASGSAIILPLRGQTIQISTDGTQFTNDFENTILKSFSFTP